LVQYLRFLVGRGPRPDLGRFSYWEKFDYLAEVWGLLIIGSTGLAMWFPESASRFLPGWIVNASLIIHSNEALLATGFLFAIHFFNTHLLPEAFPLNTAIFSGNVSLEEVREERTGWYRRLVESGAIHSASTHERRSLPVVSLLVGILFLALGIAMLTLVMSSAVAEGGRSFITLFGG
jgi:cytochrome b subunit of formate dehydrogenase